MLYRLWIASLALGACGHGSDVAGPFTGDVHRYVIDGFTLPQKYSDADSFGLLLTDDSTRWNQLGELMASMYEEGNATPYVTDMIAAGVVTSLVEIQTDDLDHDDSVGVRYLGFDGADTQAMGAWIDHGQVTSNRTATTHVLATGTVALPILIDADPIVFELDRMEIDLTPDHGGGYEGVLRGLVPPVQLRAAAALGMTQMIENDPQDHRGAGSTFDTTPRDGRVTMDEVANSTLFISFTTPDVYFDGQMWLSAGFGFHLSPCDAGRCSSTLPLIHCRDRVRDADEVDVDCGGTDCVPCPDGAACTVAKDCQSNGCDGGKCRVSTCTDGVLDGFENAVDCTEACGACTGDTCHTNSDCHSQLCVGTVCQ